MAPKQQYPPSESYAAKWQRERKARLRAAGLCPVCGKSPPTAGRDNCEQCRARMAAKTKRYMAAKLAAGKCGHCGKGPLVNQRRCKECQSKRAKDNDKRVERNRRRAATGKCIDCGIETANARARRCPEHAERDLRRRKERHANRREKVFAAYGGFRCTCECGCRESEPGFMTIDHVKGGGRKHIKEIKCNNLYHWLVKNSFPAGFRVLCYNCNSGRGRHGSNGICPRLRNATPQPEYSI